MKVRIKLKLAFLAIAFGIFLTGLLSAIKWNYCMGGDGYGLPFANIHPSHGELFFIKLGSPLKVHQMGIDLANFAGNILVLSISIYTLISFIMYLTKRLFKQQKNRNKQDISL